jgi:hypothetical protein
MYNKNKNKNKTKKPICGEMLLDACLHDKGFELCTSKVTGHMTFIVGLMIRNACTLVMYYKNKKKLALRISAKFLSIPLYCIMYDMYIHILSSICKYLN